MGDGEVRPEKPLRRRLDHRLLSGCFQVSLDVYKFINTRTRLQHMKIAIIYVVVYMQLVSYVSILTLGQQNRRISAHRPSRSLANLQT